MTESPALAEYPKTIVLRDGVQLVLRPLTDGDREAAATLVPQLPARDAGAVVAAKDGDRVAAVLALEPLPAAGMTVRVRLALATGFGGRRLGTWMLLEAAHLATVLGADQLLVEAPATASDFLAALARLDFAEQGRRDGTVSLVKRLHRGWTDF
jgi:hypothetical protein